MAYRGDCVRGIVCLYKAYASRRVFPEFCVVLHRCTGGHRTTKPNLHPVVFARGARSVDRLIQSSTYHALTCLPVFLVAMMSDATGAGMDAATKLC